MIEFIVERSSETVLTFSDVKEDQFFVSEPGYLCQKRDKDSYNIIADAEGKPYSRQIEKVESERVINKILPKVSKIEF